MIPYFAFTTIHLGPLTIQVWGLMVSLGILAATFIAGRFARKRGLSREPVYDLAFWVVLGAFIAARLGHVFFYEPGFYWANPIEALYFWHGGFSIIGGFIGALVAFLFVAKKRNLSLLSYADALVYGLPLGLGLGRIGCFLIHDHPGTATHFFLGINYPNGITYHDHGLYLSINGFLLALVFFLLARKPRARGFYPAVFLIWYGLVRFTLDFWRVGDARYWGLTPAQYASALMFILGLGLFYVILRPRPTRKAAIAADEAS